MGEGDRIIGRAFVVDLRRQLLVNQITQARLARMAGFSPVEVNRWIRGQRVPSSLNRDALREALNKILYNESNLAWMEKKDV